MRLSVAERRKLAIEATLRVIAAEGVENASTRRIAAEAGVAQSGLFYAFANRDELLAAVAEHCINSELESLTERVESLKTLAEHTEVSPDEVLRAGFSAFAQHVCDNESSEFALILLGLYARRTPGLESLADDLYVRYRELVANMLIEAARIGNFEWSLPPTDIAPAVVALCDGITLGYLMTRDNAAVATTTDAFVRMASTYVAG